MARTRLKIAVCVSGRGSNLRALFQKRKQQPETFRYDISVVISDQHCPALEYAQEKDIATYILHPEDRMINAQSTDILCEAIVLEKVDLIVLAGFMHIIRPQFIQDWKGKIINIHPSLLPKFAGLDTHQRALNAGETQHGCTVHFIDEGIDTGAIIAQSTVDILPDDDAKNLASRVLQEEHDLYCRCIAAFATSYLQQPETTFDERLCDMQRILTA